MTNQKVEPTFRADDEYRMDDPLLDPAAPHAKARARVAWLSDFLDTRFKIPGLGYPFGMDSVIGLVPGIGDAVTGAVSLYLVYEAGRAGAGPVLIARMIFNVVIDTLLGAVPLVGDLFDFVFKANLRNANLLRDHLEKSREQARYAPDI